MEKYIKSSIKNLEVEELHNSRFYKQNKIRGY